MQDSPAGSEKKAALLQEIISATTGEVTTGEVTTGEVLQVSYNTGASPLSARKKTREPYLSSTHLDCPNLCANQNLRVNQNLGANQKFRWRDQPFKNSRTKKLTQMPKVQAWQWIIYLPVQWYLPATIN